MDSLRPRAESNRRRSGKVSMLYKRVAGGALSQAERNGVLGCARIFRDMANKLFVPSLLITFFFQSSRKLRGRVCRLILERRERHVSHYGTTKPIYQSAFPPCIICIMRRTVSKRSSLSIFRGERFLALFFSFPITSFLQMSPPLSVYRLSPRRAAANGGNSSECAGARPRCSQCASRPKHSPRQ